MADSTYNLIEHWKRNAPRPKEQIPFASIMNGLSTPFSAVELKEDTVGRWSVRSSNAYAMDELTVYSFDSGGCKKLQSSLLQALWHMQTMRRQEILYPMGRRHLPARTDGRGKPRTSTGGRGSRLLTRSPKTEPGEFMVLLYTCPRHVD